MGEHFVKSVLEHVGARSLLILLRKCDGTTAASRPDRYAICVWYPPGTLFMGAGVVAGGRRGIGLFVLHFSQETLTQLSS